MTKRSTTQPPRASENALAQLVCNGIDATTGEYLFPATDVRQLARAATGLGLVGEERDDVNDKSRRSRQKNYRVIEGVDANDLAQAGWAVVFPAADEGSDLAARQATILAALAPLLAHRRSQATANANLYQEYTGNRGYHAGDTKQQYLGRLGAGTGPVDPKVVPYYLLLVATPEEIPYHIQYQLDVQYAVGRIAFDTSDEYARYARSVVEAETGQVTRARRAAFFGVANPNDKATLLSADHLVIPLIAHVEERTAQHGFTVGSYLGDPATREHLIEELSDPPALLFTASHGMGFPCGDANQRERQGALLCQNWPGPGNRVTREHYFAGEDVPAGADLRGMIGVFFACFGGGTPVRDEFTRRALGEVKAKELVPAPIIARLPQRMLGHPGGGALAVVAHIDRAWASSFLWFDPQGKGQTVKHLVVFKSMLDSLMAGQRLGYAMEAFNLRYAELAADLSERIEQIQSHDEHYEESELANMWISNSDARNYAVFGDPAVHIPRAPNTTSTARPDGAPERKPVTPRDAAAPTRTSGMSEARQPEPVAQQASADPKKASPDPNAQGAQQDAKGAQPAQASQQPFGWFGGKDDQQPGFLAQLGKKLGDMLGGVLSDASTLEVKTYTSDDLQAVANGQPLSASPARLRAYTRCALDGDTDACIPVNKDGVVDATVWALHVEIVRQAQANRTELLKTVLSLFSSRVVG